MIPMIRDAVGGAFMAWTTGNHSVDGRVRVMLQHVDRTGGVVSGWGLSGTEAIPSSTSQYQTYPRLDVDTGGRLAVLLSSDDTYRLLKLLEPDGTTAQGWPDSGIVVGHDPTSGTTFQPAANRVAFVGDTGLVVAWSESRVDTAGNSDLFGLRLDLRGDLLAGWPVVGIPLCQAQGNDLLEQLAVFDPLGFDVLWTDARSNLQHGVFDYRDGATPSGPQARLLSHNLVGRRLAALWASHAVEGHRLVSLASFDDGPMLRRGSLSELGASTVALTDTLPLWVSQASYLLAIDDGIGAKAISDTLRVALGGEPSMLSIRAAVVQTGSELDVGIEANHLVEGVVLRLFDVGGRCIWMRTVGRVGPGIVRTTIPTRGLSQGVVFVSANGRGVVATTRTVIVR
jgi:hypothetical protein